MYTSYLLHTLLKSSYMMEKIPSGSALALELNSIVLYRFGNIAPKWKITLYSGDETTLPSGRPDGSSLMLMGLMINAFATVK